ncbi:mannose-6-phosphate isomerase [Thermoclostridium stercorarium subsp. stercorarium DSM 8532]|uniref:Mannose-6-phosphate isomerase n=3 Tax=Thermoclostridium stercorarium TaxID=1510 RepID=L7VKR3_THES1|nr:cupin domain-containing protein [Thermoclostridium stercorarium]AGC68710.1 mannose-6-phosphate isomerase [Thermoclostridium stercorarium subsp. stercorarium DSM 8532]AGI39719.1 cupin domain-containing protein [Thermoclostridium stercorarium subsp. stercorarium DSM 8532]ANW99043.1 cupin [Thermoclostridium stercorarium subsp. thermolacticum DSM 2910]ANX01571.1 cupin [Thermoclostridium stercorarium subsp. leptospartum DSM 9219]UZQ84689.1 cupin domain-containing protein [Thermoclostridium sterc
MKTANFYEKEPKFTTSHSGKGIVRDVVLFNENDFQTNLRFFRYMVLPSGSSIGFHKHGDNEEIYVILDGNGIMKVNDDEIEVKPGDVIVNQPFDSHGLVNNSEGDLKILVFEVTK